MSTKEAQQRNSELTRDEPKKETDADFEKAKKFSKQMIAFFDTIKTVRKIGFLVAVLLKVCNATIKQEITRFCLEWIRQYPEASSHPAMNDSVKFCNGVKKAFIETHGIELNKIKFEKIIISDE